VENQRRVLPAPRRCLLLDEPALLDARLNLRAACAPAPRDAL